MHEPEDQAEVTQVGWSYPKDRRAKPHYFVAGHPACGRQRARPGSTFQTDRPADACYRCLLSLKRSAMHD